MHTLDVYPDAGTKLDQQVLKYAEDTLRILGDRVTPATREAILAQTVVLGMSPFEAKLAAGLFFFRVDADHSVWPATADPYDVMWRQSTHPDHSHIWMTFETQTQYPTLGETQFTVYFERGRALRIDRLTSADD
jgi:hypothetical protein